MKDSRFLLAALPLFASAVSAVASSTQQDGILSFPLKASSARSLSRRQTDVGLDSHLTGTIYTIDITIGLPGNAVAVQLNTGSDETWVNPLCMRSFDPQLCEEAGRFSQSATWVDLYTEGTKQFGSGYVNFRYGYDWVSIGPITLESQIFGVAYDSEFATHGHLGLAPSLFGWDSSYPFVLDTMFYQGYINSRAFSLDLRGIGSDNGAIIFGGIDTRRYIGYLERLAIVPAAASPDGYTRYWINANAITVSRPGVDETFVFEGSQSFSLDSSYTLSGFPTPIFYALLEAFPQAIPIPGSNQYSVPCSVADESGSVDFTFGNTLISVPLREFIWQQPQGCYLGAFQSDSYPVLGATFLRAAYVVFDWDNREVHIGPSTTREDCGSELVAIGSGRDAVPSVVGTCTTTPTTTSSDMSTSTSMPPSSSSEASSTISSDSALPSSSDVSISSDVVSSSAVPTSSDVASSSVISSSVVSSSVVSSDVVSSSALSSSVQSGGISSSSTLDSSSSASSTTDASEILSTSSSVSASTSSEASSSIFESPSSSDSVISSSATSSADSSASTSSTVSKTSSDASTASSSEYSSDPCDDETSVISSVQASETSTTDSITSTVSSHYGTITRPPLETSTVTATTTYTITSCDGNVPYCTVGDVTTEVTTRYTTFCPPTTATYTLPGTFACRRETCKAGEVTEPRVVTVFPITTRSEPVVIPGYSEGIGAFTSPGHEAHVPSHETGLPGASSEIKGHHGSEDVTKIVPTATYDHVPIFTSIFTSVKPGNASSTGSGDDAVVTAGASMHGVSSLLGLCMGLLVALL